MRFFALGFVLLAVGLPVFASAVSLNGYAWSETIGWVKFSGDGYGVEYNEGLGTLSGYAWSPNIGWVRFEANGPQWARACAGAYNSGCTGMPHPEAGGWDGWIKLRGDNGEYGVHLNQETCQLSGWAWGSDIVGWLKLSGPGYGVDVSGCVPTEPLPEPEPEPEVPPPTCRFTASPTQVAKAGRSTLTWDCADETGNQTADSCAISEAPGAPTDPQGTFRTDPLSRTSPFTLTCRRGRAETVLTARVTVLRPFYCEVIPFLGTCR